MTEEADLESYASMSVNGYPYKRENGKWVRDEEARDRQLAREAEEQRRKDELIWSCRSRVCTSEEMAEIESLGIDLFLRVRGGMSQSFSDTELNRQFNDLLLQQFRLRRIAESPSQ